MHSFAVGRENTSGNRIKEISAHASQYCWSFYSRLNICLDDRYRDVATTSLSQASQ